MNINIAGHLTSSHMNLNNFSKMKVYLAAHTLSLSVASGIRCVVHLTDKMPKDALYFYSRFLCILQ